jgi:tRNA modification GTPase
VETHAPGLCVLYPAGRSYTGEEAAELLLPGAPPLGRALLDACRNAGARPAERGEFTFRAFRSGRLHLGQAEAVRRLASATTETARAGLLARLDRSRPDLAGALRGKLVALAAELEAALDFEEPETGPSDAAALAARAEALAAEARAALPEADTPEAPEAEGIPVRLLGPTGSGKSALANALLGREAALVGTERPTTRDRLRLPLRLGARTILLEDGPGFLPDAPAGRGPPSPEGTDRGENAASGFAGGIVCIVQAGCAPLPPPPPDLAGALRDARVLLLLSKSDLPAAVSGDAARGWLAAAGAADADVLRVSAETGAGLPELRSWLEAVAGAAEGEDEGTFSAREAARLREVAGALEGASNLLRTGSDLALAAEELRNARAALGRALGEDSPEELLEAVFARFCIGK